MTTKKGTWKSIVESQKAKQLYVALLKDWRNTTTLTRLEHHQAEKVWPTISNYFSAWQRAGYLTAPRYFTRKSLSSGAVRRSHYKTQRIPKYRANEQALVDYCAEQLRWKPRAHTHFFLNKLFESEYERSTLLKGIDGSRLNVFETVLVNLRNFLFLLLEAKPLAPAPVANKYSWVYDFLFKHPVVLADFVRGPYKDLSRVFMSQNQEQLISGLELLFTSEISSPEEFAAKFKKKLPELWNQSIRLMAAMQGGSMVEARDVSEWYLEGVAQDMLTCLGTKEQRITGMERELKYMEENATSFPPGMIEDAKQLYEREKQDRPRKS